MGQSAATTPGKKSGSVFDQSAAGLANAGKATLAAGQGYGRFANSRTGGLGGVDTYNPALISGKLGTYNPASMQGAGYGAAQQAGPAAIASGIKTYMNPYTSDVIKRTQADIQRQTQLGIGGLGTDASKSGAFGGSRHGIAEGTAIGEGSKALGDISAQLRQQGFDTAAQLAGTDIANRMSVAGQNQAAINAARQFTAGNTQAARTANQAAINAARNFGATNRLGIAEYNAGARNTAGQFNAGQRSQHAQDVIANRMAGLAGLQGAGQQGAALAGQGMEIGGGLAGQQAAGGQTIQDITKALLGQSAGMFDQYVGQPLQSTAAILNMLSGNPLNAAKGTTQTNTPGTKSMLSDALGVGLGIARQ